MEIGYILLSSGKKFDLDKETTVLSRCTLPVARDERAEIVEVVLHDYISEICQATFKGCKKLKKVILDKEESSLRYIGRDAFLGCSELSDFVFPNALGYIGEHAFQYTNLRHVEIGGAIIRERAFINCENLMSVVFLGEYLGPACFGSCRKLKSVELPYTKFIHGYAFFDCDNIKLVESYHSPRIKTEFSKDEIIIKEIGNDALIDAIKRSDD